MVEIDKNYRYVGTKENGLGWIKELVGKVGTITKVIDETFVEFSYHESGSELTAYRVRLSSLQVMQ